MNEKIKSLAEQAMWHTHSKTGKVYRTHFEFNERFAELIVKECANIAWNNEPDGEISDLIKEHFGIQE